MLDYLFNSYTYLIFNGIIMISLISLYTISRVYEIKNYYFKNILRGLEIGLIIIFVMIFSYKEPINDNIYDSRNIVLNISGIFFGTYPTIISLLVASAFRIIIGGSGTYLGIIEMIIATIIGITWKYIRKILPKKVLKSEYFILGLVTHLFSASLIFISGAKTYNPLREIFLPYFLIFPVFTFIAAMIIIKYFKFIELSTDYKRQQTLTQSVLNSTKTMEVYALDDEYRYLDFNLFHQVMMREHYDKNIKRGDIFLDYIYNDKMKERLKNSYDKALTGLEHKLVSQIETNLSKFVEETFSPIVFENKIIGVTVFSTDVTTKVTQKQELEYLSYNDVLTDTYNRRYFEYLVDEYERIDQFISVIYFDINGLKFINDTFGHEQGDNLIKNTTKVIKKVISNKGDLCRIGGDEFVVLLKEVSEIDTFNYANEIKTKVDALKINNISYSISYGVYNNKEVTLSEAISEAENKMFRNKLIERSSHRSASIPALLNALNFMYKNEQEHSSRVSNYAEIIGRELKVSETMIGLLKMIARLHDIGKIGIDKTILEKPDKLTEKEFNEIKRHTIIGHQLLQGIPEYSEIANDVLSHHERFDGMGYPNGLKGKDIPFRARIISVADSFDAMISDRPYRKAMSIEDAIKELKDNSGSQFDPDIVNAFLRGLKKQQGL